jgi:hypothetical protein
VEPVVHPSGRSTVEELVQDFVDGVLAQDRELVLSLFPPRELMEEALTCPGPNILVEAVDHALEELDEVMAELAGADVQFVYLGIVPRRGDTTSYAAGQGVEDGCTAAMDVTIREVQVKARITESGHTEEDTDELIAVRFGEPGPWYLVGPD